eukprot:9099621-Prorocentrum_lima.AAC.1
MMWSLISRPLCRRVPLQLPRLEAELADHRSSLICRCLRPMLSADKSAWITSLSEAVSTAPPQHQ